MKRIKNNKGKLLIGALVVLAVSLMLAAATVGADAPENPGGPGSWTVDIGTPSSETQSGIALDTCWGPIEPTTHGGGWGGLASDPNSPDKKCRTTWGYDEGDDPIPPGPGCPRCAAITYSYNVPVVPTALELRALDGGSDDSFEVTVDGILVFAWVGEMGAEVWYVHGPIDLTGLGMSCGVAHTVEICATGPAGTYWKPYGQLGIDWVTLTTAPTEVWVDDDYCDGCANDGHTWGYDAFDNIQDGVNAVACSTVNVAAGVYEEEVTIDKSLTLQGGSRPVLDGGGTMDHCILVNADNVTIQSIECQNYTGDQIYSGTSDTANDLTVDDVWSHDSVTDEGLQIKGSDRITVKNSKFWNNAGDGICLSYGQGHSVTGNEVWDNADRGIYLYGEDSGGDIPQEDVEVKNNVVWGSQGTVSDEHVGGIILYVVHGATIEGNECYDNVGPGIHLYKVNFNANDPPTLPTTVQDNVCYGNTAGNVGGDGIRLYLTNYTTVQENRCFDNGRDGIRLAGCLDTGSCYGDPPSHTANNDILDNVVYGNTGVGIHSVDAQAYGNTIYGSLLHTNGTNGTDNNPTATPNQWDDASSVGNTWDDCAAHGAPPTYLVPGTAGAVDHYPNCVPSVVWVDDDFTSSTPGWGVDHFDKIQDGIDAVAAYGTVNVAPGTYTEQLTIDKGLTLTGCPGDAAPGPGPSAPILDCGGAVGSAITIAGGVSNVTLEGFEIRNCRNRPLGEPWTTGGIGSGILAWDSDPIDNVTVRDNYMHDLGWSAVLVGNEGQALHDNWLVEDNVVEDCAAYAIELTNAQNSSVIQNVVTGGEDILDEADDDSQDGILIQTQIHTGPGLTNSSIVVEDNTVSGPLTRAGIEILAWDSTDSLTAGLNNVTVSYNKVTGAERGVYVLTYGANANISDLDIDKDNYLDGNGDGVQIRDAASGTHGSINVVGNQIINSTNDGVRIRSGTSAANIAVNFNNISGNVLKGVNNEGTGTLDAENNWWGATNGPGPVGSGSGDGVSTNVDYDPWAHALVTLAPWRQVLYVSQEVTLDINITADDLYGFQMILHFDPANLEVTGAEWDDTWFKPEEIPPEWNLVADNVNGTVKIAAYQLHPTPPVSGIEKRVAWITFHCTAPSLDHIWLEALILATIEGEEIPSTYTSAIIKNVDYQPGSIIGTVDLQGRSDESGAVVAALPGWYSDTSDASGSYTVVLPAGTYNVYMEMARYLDEYWSGVVVPVLGTADLGSVRLLGGDCNDDDTIDINDATVLGPAFGSSVPPGDARADINADGKVNILDAVILGGNWHKSSPVSW